MLTDLRYALGQIKRGLRADRLARESEDCFQRAVDALERCIEAAPAMVAAYAAHLDAIESANLPAGFVDRIADRR